MRLSSTLFIIILSMALCAQDYIPMSRIANINYGSSGKGLIWDFSHLEKVTDSELRISYLSSDSSMIRVYDGNTHYNLHRSADSLLIDGYENRLVHASYSEPQIWRQHIGYGDTCRSQYSGSIEYSHQTCDSVAVRSFQTLDAIGLIVLPDMKSIGNRFHNHRDISLFGKDTTILSEDTYLWFAEDAICPLVIYQEIHEAISGTDTTIMQDAWVFDETEYSHPSISADAKHQPSGIITSLCHYPNPVESGLFVCYSLSVNADVTMSLTMSGGLPVWNKQLGVQSEGDHIETIELGGLPRGTYELHVIAGECVLGETIIKL